MSQARAWNGPPPVPPVSPLLVVAVPPPPAVSPPPAVPPPPWPLQPAARSRQSPRASVPGCRLVDVMKARAASTMPPWPELRANLSKGSISSVLSAVAQRRAQEEPNGPGATWPDVRRTGSEARRSWRGAECASPAQRLLGSRGLGSDRAWDGRRGAGIVVRCLLRRNRPPRAAARKPAADAGTGRPPNRPPPPGRSPNHTRLRLRRALRPRRAPRPPLRAGARGSKNPHRRAGAARRRRRRMSRGRRSGAPRRSSPRPWKPWRRGWSVSWRPSRPTARL